MLLILIYCCCAKCKKTPLSPTPFLSAEAGIYCGRFDWKCITPTLLSRRRVM